MSHTRLITKDGKNFYAPINYWRPEENWFSLFVDGKEIRFSFDDVLLLITPEERIHSNKIGELDEMERASKDLADGRKFNWPGYPKEKFRWEN